MRRCLLPPLPPCIARPSPSRGRLARATRLIAVRYCVEIANEASQDMAGSCTQLYHYCDIFHDRIKTGQTAQAKPPSLPFLPPSPHSRFEAASLSSDFILSLTLLQSFETKLSSTSFPDSISNGTLAVPRRQQQASHAHGHDLHARHRCTSLRFKPAYASSHDHVMQPLTRQSSMLSGTRGCRKAARR